LRISTTRFACTCFAPPTTTPASSSRPEILRSPPTRTAHLAHSSTCAQSKGQPGGDPLQVSTTRLACTCFPSPLSITNNSDSDYNLIQPPLWHCASGRFFDSSAKQGPPRILLFRASDFRSTSSAPVLNGSRNSWTARNKSKRTYWGNSVSSASFR
jgi:hypothetical protein